MEKESMRYHWVFHSSPSLADLGEPIDSVNWI